jgi:cytoskeletal protein CcmA (bactofilin family)
MSKKADFSKYDKVETTLQRGTILDGVLRFKKPLKISGVFEGEIESETLLIIDSSAEVQADVNAKVVIVSGCVTGNITASDRIEILSGGRVRGNLKSARIKIADNVEFEGRCRMIKDPETIDIFSARVEKLKEIAQSG